MVGPTHGCLWTDYDLDGDVDLFVGGQDKVQFRNDQDGVFTWIPPQDGGIPRSEKKGGAAVLAMRTAKRWLKLGLSLCDNASL